MIKRENRISNPEGFYAKAISPRTKFLLQICSRENFSKNGNSAGPQNSKKRGKNQDTYRVKYAQSRWDDLHTKQQNP